MDTKIIARDGLCVEIGEVRQRDDRVRRALQAKLYALAPSGQGRLKENPDAYDTFLEEDIVAYTYAVAQVRSHSGFELPSVTDTPEVIYAAFQQVDELPYEFVREWVETASIFRKPKSQRDLVPTDFLTDEQKKMSKSGSGEKPNEGASTKPRKEGS